MPDYNEQAGQYSSWTRCKYIGIDNPRPHLGVPAVTFVEERCINVDGEEVQRPLGNLVEPFTPENAGEAFDLVDPETGSVLGSMTYQGLYVALASAYLHVATKRDQAQSAPPENLAE
ncbi:hypothetical protein LF844_09945 [Metapseudomonas lalkuanensis]|uniref:hypothetical protein n=1 Tax=Metapseudomonas lalkuanensis TaxID=2604832 RepID=UPI001CF4CA8B|nr:hypothetical protein [Pseudomonas lalkuanensis]UCP00111.1 hypothetical protein LF844_09945 [Pseudomonas lalkuanensis]